MINMLLIKQLVCTLFLLNNTCLLLKLYYHPIIINIPSVYIVCLIVLCCIVRVTGDPIVCGVGSGETDAWSTYVRATYHVFTGDHWSSLLQPSTLTTDSWENVFTKLDWDHHWTVPQTVATWLWLLPWVRLLLDHISSNSMCGLISL